MPGWRWVASQTGEDWWKIAKSVRRQGSVPSGQGSLRQCRLFPHAVSLQGYAPVVILSRCSRRSAAKRRKRAGDTLRRREDFARDPRVHIAVGSVHYAMPSRRPLVQPFLGGGEVASGFSSVSLEEVATTAMFGGLVRSERRLGGGEPMRRR